MRGRAPLLFTSCLMLLLAACCPAAVPSTADRAGSSAPSVAGGVPPATAEFGATATAFVAVIEVDPDGSLWARSDHGRRTRLERSSVSADEHVESTRQSASQGTGGVEAASSWGSALRPGELVYVTGSWSQDGSLRVASIQLMASARH